MSIKINGIDTDDAELTLKAHKALGICHKGGEFDTDNGEMPDWCAAWLLHSTNSPSGVNLYDKATSDAGVDRSELIDWIGEVGRSCDWHPFYEYLATWAINHD